MSLVDSFLNYYHANTADGAKVACFVFVFGHMAICALTTVICFASKKQKTIYDISGYFLGSSLVSIFTCLIILIPLVLFSFQFKVIFYTGIVVTMLCYIIIFRYFNIFNNIGKKLS